MSTEMAKVLTVSAQYVPVIRDLIRKHWPLDHYDSELASNTTSDMSLLMGRCKAQSTIKPWPHVMRLVSRISARIFHSAAAAENNHWLDIATEHVHSTVVWTERLKKWPAILRPFVYRFVKGRGYMMQRFEEGKTIVAQTLQEKKAYGGAPLSDPPSLLDHLCDGVVDPDDVEGHTVAQINLVVAAIQSMASSVTQCLMDLAMHPEYVPGILEEIRMVIGSNGGVVDKRVMTEMWKLDSFIKETQRFNPSDLSLLPAEHHIIKRDSWLTLRIYSYLPTKGPLRHDTLQRTPDT